MASQSLPATHDVPREPAPASTAPGQADSPRPELYAAQLEQSRQQAEDQLLALRTLQQIAQSLTSELNLDKLLRKVLRSALDVMEADAGSLLLHDPATDQLVFEVIEGGASEALKGRRMSSADGIAGWVFTHGESLIVDDTSKDNRFYADIDKSFGHKTWSLICVPLIITGKKIGVLEVLNKISGARFTSADRDILSALAAQSAIAIENARLYQDLWEERNRILAVEEEVRKELARDVHDGPAQLLSAMVMNIRFIQALLTDNSISSVQDELHSLEDLATRTLRQIRELLFDQRPLILETQGLFAALETYVRNLATSGEMAITLDVAQACKPIKLPGKADRTVFSIVQEAIGNVKKHARGASVHITITHQNGHLTVSVKDTGPGFDVNQVKDTYDQRGSLGLLNMQERAQQLGGVLRIESALGQGTEVILTVPLNAQPRTLSPRA